MLTWGSCGGMGLGGWLLMVGLWVGLITAVVWAISRLFPAMNRRGEAGELLDRRLAAGEIDPATYRSVRSELAGAHHLSAGRG
jgi:uncharacterized membrane protein